MRALVGWCLPLLVSVLGASLPGCTEEKEPVAPAETLENPEVPLVPFDGVDIGPEGGVVAAPEGSGYPGVSLRIPPGALAATTRISFRGVLDETPLPETAERVGPPVQLLPVGLALAVPAELTLPVDDELVAGYAMTSASCKVWARDAEGWQKLEAIATGPGSVTVPIATFTTAAAGVNFTSFQSCVKVPCEPPPPPCDALEGSAVPFCLQALPQAEHTRGVDEFASLTIVGRKLYWGATDSEGRPTIARYDLDAPGPVFLYPPLEGDAVGTIAVKGQVAVQSNGDAWVGFQGFGNVYFPLNATPTVFETGNGVGVVGAGGNEVYRFRRANVVNNGRVSKTDVSIFKNKSSTARFVFNYPIMPSENITGIVNQDADPDGAPVKIRSVHRGLGATNESNGLPGGFAAWLGQDANPGIRDDDNPKTFGAAAFWKPDVAAVIQGNTVQRRRGFSFVVFDKEYVFPDGVRDLAWTKDGELFAIGPGKELFALDANGGKRTYPFPETELSSFPWRLRTLPGTNDLLLVTRGSLLKKGAFFLLKKR